MTSLLLGESLALLMSDLREEVAIQAGCSLLRKRAMHLPPAQGAGNGPTDPTGILTIIDALVESVRSRGTDTELVGLRPAGLPAAGLEFPAVLLLGNSLLFLVCSGP